MKVKSESEVAQSCPTPSDPMDYSPPGSSVHGDFPGKNTGVGCQALLQGMFPTQGSNPSPTLQADPLPSKPAGKAMTKQDNILKSRVSTLLTKVHLVKAMVFTVVMYGYESWTIKKDKLWRTDAFELWYWRTLESPLDCKEIQPVRPKGNQT